MGEYAVRTHTCNVKYLLYLREEAPCSWRRLNQQERPHVIRQPFPFLSEDIVRELLEGQKTGRSAAETTRESVLGRMKGSEHMNENTPLKICSFTL